MKQRPPEPLVERASRVFLRPLGNPLPLGFIALAAATLLVSGLQLGSAAEGEQVSLILVAFVFPCSHHRGVRLSRAGRDCGHGNGDSGQHLARNRPRHARVASGSDQRRAGAVPAACGARDADTRHGGGSGQARGGVALCALGLYAALAMALEDAEGETVLPLGRRGRGRESIGSTLEDQIARVEREAGVRTRL
jgi:uncharacterized protein